MDEQSSRQLHRSSLTAVFLSGGALLALTISMPILCTMVNQLEEDISVARKNYDEMSNFMWKDLREQDKHIRGPRQTYKEGAAPVPEGGGGGSSGGRTCSAEKCVSSSCPAGEPGPKGSDGQPGPNGLDGVPGKNGASASFGGDSYIQGSAGGSCPPCPAGPPGAPGYRGKKGPRGPKGEKGPSGNPGRDGEPGDEGTEGDIGRPGPVGEPGPRGPPGEPGMGFSKGAMGARGPMGPIGPEGDEGLPGERGEDAAPGAMGPPGPPGPPGEPGPDGIPGSPGKSGGHGADANYCPCPARKQEAEVVSGGPTKDKYVAPAGETVSGSRVSEDSYKSKEAAPEIPAAPTGEVSSPAKETEAAPETTAAPAPSGTSESYKSGEGQAYREPINKATFAKQLRRKLVLL